MHKVTQLGNSGTRTSTSWMPSCHILLPLDHTVRKKQQANPLPEFGPHHRVSVLNRTLAGPSLLQRGESIHPPVDKGKRNSLAMNGPSPLENPENALYPLACEVIQRKEEKLHREL